MKKIFLSLLFINIYAFASVSFNSYEEEVYGQVDNYRQELENVPENTWSLLNDECNFDRQRILMDSMEQSALIKQQVLDYMMNMATGVTDVIGTTITSLSNEVMNDLSGSFNIFNMDMLSDEMCTFLATEKCSNPTNYLDTGGIDKLNGEIQLCFSEMLKGSTQFTTENQAGRTVIGCNVRPGTGPATMVPTFPVMSNPTTTMIPCPPCGSTTCPTGTPMPRVIASNDTASTVDLSAASSASQCTTNIVYDTIGEAFEQCLIEEKATCISMQQETLGIAKQAALNDYENQFDKCDLKYDALRRDYKEEVNQQLEGTMLPNNYKILNSEIVKSDPTIVGVNAFELQEFDHIGINTILNKQCKNNIVQQITNETKTEMFDWCIEFANIPFEQRDLWVENELTTIDNRNNYNLMNGKYNVLHRYIYEKNKILKDRYIIYRRYDQERIINYGHKAQELEDWVYRELNKYDKAFDLEYDKFDMKLINAKTDISNIHLRDLENKIIQRENEKRLKKKRILQKRQQQSILKQKMKSGTLNANDLKSINKSYKGFVTPN